MNDTLKSGSQDMGSFRKFIFHIPHLTIFSRRQIERLDNGSNRAESYVRIQLNDLLEAKS